MWAGGASACVAIIYFAAQISRGAGLVVLSGEPGPQHDLLPPVGQAVLPLTPRGTLAVCALVVASFTALGALARMAAKGVVVATLIVSAPGEAVSYSGLGITASSMSCSARILPRSRPNARDSSRAAGAVN